jgi:hypothetical protein
MTGPRPTAQLAPGRWALLIRQPLPQWIYAHDPFTLN